MEENEEKNFPIRKKGLPKPDVGYLQSLSSAFKSANSPYKSLQTDLFPSSGSLIGAINSAKKDGILRPEVSDVSEKNDSIFKSPKNINELADQELLTTL